MGSEFICVVSERNAKFVRFISVLNRILLLYTEQFRFLQFLPITEHVQEFLRHSESVRII